MNQARIDKYEARSKRSAIAAGIGIFLMFAGMIASGAYSGMAEKERRNDPIYRKELEKKEAEERKLREQELETERQRYLLEQEKLKVAKENKRLDVEREKKAQTLSEIDALSEVPEFCSEYSYIDRAYRVLSAVKDGFVDEEVKYRALSVIDDFSNACVSKAAKSRFNKIINDIEAL